MNIYLGTNKVKINFRGEKLRLNFRETQISPIIINKLLSSDDYILKDLNGLYLIPKQEVNSNVNGI